MTFVRPNGYFTSRFVDDQKRNPIEMLKHFLFNNTSGRTDVLFVGERNTYFQDPRQSKRPALVGGLADGIAKALLTSTAFSTRTLYATPIYWGYHGNAPGDAYNETTFNWSDDTASGNPEGHGRCLVGTKYGFDSYAYTRNSSNNVVLPLNAEKNSVNSPAVSPWLSALFLPEMYGSSSQLNAAWFTPIFFENSYNYGQSNIGPISYPQFLGTKTKHILFPNIPMPMPIGKYNQSTNIITEYFIDSTTLPILRNSEINVNERFPNNITVGDNISTLDNTKFTFDNGIINFKCKINEFLIPILKHKGWTVCESGPCTGQEDAYFGNYLDQSPSDLWVLNRHLPYNYSGAGNEYLFADKNTSEYFTNYKFGFVSDKHLNSNISGLYNGEADRGLPACVHYTRVPQMGLCMGSDFLKTNFEYSNQFPSSGFKLTFDKFNVANQKISSYFVWKKDWENESNLTYKKEKKIILNTNLGSVLNTFSVTPSLNVTLRTPTDKATLYTTTNFEYKVKYWDLRVDPTTSVPNNQSKLAITIAKRVNNVWTNLVNTSHSFTSPTSFTSPSATRKYVTTTIDLTSPNNVAPEYSLSFTGFNSNNRLEGDNIIINHWGENVNDTNGISFSHLYMSEDFRSGDVAYAFQAALVKQQFYEIFDSIKERQKNNPEGNKKVVIAIPCLRFENANPGDGYVSGWSQQYMSGIKESILNTAYKCGFSENEIVVWFIGPMFGPKVNYWSNEITNYSTDAPRATYLKSQFIMIGSAATNPLGGLLKAHEPWTPNSPSDQHYIPNALYTDLEQVSSLGGIRDTLSNNTTSRAVYSSTSADGEESFFHTPSIEGFLVVGHELVKSVESITSASYFAPPWVIAYSYMLNYEFDPVSEANLAFVTPSLDPVDIKPYLVAFDNICDDPTSSYNFQAKSILNKFKTKILQ